jgi:16S rRNA (cytidine1402-2'-O)-methyltransferase
MMHTLFVVGTPLGNVADWSPRAQQVLAAVPVIAAEDTRVTARLLAACGMGGVRLITYTDAFAPKQAQRQAEVLAALAHGDVALVSDAGMPGISDPGTALVQAAMAAGHRIVPVPGPSAVVTALAISGLPADRFVFVGFLPRHRADREQLLRQVADETGTLVAYEVPHRLLESLADLHAVLGDRTVMVARELTKAHETLWHGRLAEAVAALTTPAPRGEYVLVIAGIAASPHVEEGGWSPARVRDALAIMLSEGVDERAAQRVVARLAGWRKKDVYRLSFMSEATHNDQPG